MSEEETPQRAFARVVRAAREARQWRQIDLAKAADVSEETVKRYENAKSEKPDARHVIAIAKVLALEPVEAFLVLGYTRDELGLQAKDAAIDEVLARAKRLLDDPAIPDRAKDTLRRGINAAIDLWFEAYGVGQAPREPSAEERGSGRAGRPRGRRSSGQAV
jgi:transcriptional regulator with XRE-family HTH domain